MSDVAEQAVDIAADIAGDISQHAAEAEQAIRSLTGVKLGYGALGMVIGAAISGFVTYKVTIARANTKYSQIAEEEIDAMREHFRQKLVARDEKPELSELAKQHGDIVDEAGYSGDGPPMAVQPPEDIVTTPTEDPRPEPGPRAKGAYDPDNPLPLDPEERRKEAERRDPELKRNIFDEPDPDDVWDINEELRHRSPLRPYVIHFDERDESAYEQVTYTYYELDDVLCNERDEVIGEANNERNFLVGESNLDKFGHGSRDRNVVYVRNDKLELDMEICKSPHAYMEEVHGLEPPDKEIRHGDRRRGRIPFDDE